MNIESAREYLLSFPFTTEDMPFGDDLVVFRVGGKIFSCLPLEHPSMLVLKCAPNLFDDLVAEHPSIQQAYHWHKKHWIQINLSGEDISNALVTNLSQQAYQLVYNKLTKKLRSQLGNV